MGLTISRVSRIATFAVLLAAAGCERSDPRLENLTVGIGKDSVIKAMEGTAPKRVDPYLYQGQYIETLYYPKKGYSDPKSLEDRSMAPLVVINGKLSGWGWAYWDSVAGANHIPIAKGQ